MGMNTWIPGRSSFKQRESAYNNFKSSIHKARVTDVNIDKGTVSVRVDGSSHKDTVNFPLLGSSVPPDPANDNTPDFSKAAWGRYTPHVGDVLLVGFSTNNVLHALGYDTPYFPGFKKQDDDAEGEGGIGWGEASGKQIVQGGWDFMSSEKSYLTLGKDARIGHRSSGTTYSGSKVETASTLVRTNTSSSTLNWGQVSRKLLPTDATDTDVPSTRGTMAQEFSFEINGLDAVPSNLGYVAYGDVVVKEGLTYLIKTSGQGLTTRKYTELKDELGQTTTFEEAVDSGGNYEQTANLAVSTKYTTPLSAWEVLNLSTKITSTENFEIISLATTFTTTTDFTVNSTVNLGLTAGAKADFTSVGAMTLKAPSISLATGNLSIGASPATITGTGALTFLAPSITFGATAPEPLLRGTTFNSALTTHLTGLSTFLGAMIADTGLKVVAPATVTAAGVFQPIVLAFLASLPSTLTTTTKAG